MVVGLVHHPRCKDHDPGPGHPERPQRLEAVLGGLGEAGIWDDLDVTLAEPVERGALARVHTAAHMEAVRQAGTSARGPLDAGDTWVSPGSWDAALLSAGGLLQACERVRTGVWSSAFCALRPPGHHAEETHAMGFCLFNNVAVAARALRSDGLARVAIVDWDVHHGNGTQHLFERDASVFYASLHQFPHYPGTGAAAERGIGAGRDATLNLPQAAGSGDADWLRAFEDALLPALDDFRPEFVLVSAGFDAHARDPLFATLLTDAAFARMTELLLDVARRHASGRLVSTLEGGYDLEALASSSAAHVGALLAAG